MDVHIIMSTTEVIITSVIGPAGLIIYFLMKTYSKHRRVFWKRRA
jgi:hypothetical protein